MLPYQDGQELEGLLEDLFAGDDESALEDFEVLRRPGIFSAASSCCTYSYGCYTA